MTERRLRAIVRRPGGDLAACELTYLGREPIDPIRVARQHAAYVAALEDLGVEVTILDPLAGYPDALYVEDCAIVLDELAVLTRPGALSRRGEVETIAEALADHRELFGIEDPGTLEGGDVVVVGRTLYVGLTSRTNKAGVEQLAGLLAEHGYSVEGIEVDGCLHFKSAVTSLGGERLLANPGWTNLDWARGLEIVEVDSAEPFGANVLPVGEGLLASADYPRTNERLRQLGYDVHELDLSELHKMEAAVTCPSLVFKDRA